MSVAIVACIFKLVFYNLFLNPIVWGDAMKPVRIVGTRILWKSTLEKSNVCTKAYQEIGLFGSPSMGEL